MPPKNKNRTVSKVKSDKKPSVLLDEEEKDYLESFENDEWESVSDLDEEKKIAAAAALNYLKKNSRINIRISSSDLSRIKQKAAFEGLPYQTLIASVLHKYAAGHLNLKDER